MNVAVVGAGIAGLRLARLLNAEGMDVRVFDKARGPSGRLATRRGEHGQFDHGAQYFTARSSSFSEQVAEWCRQGVIAEWDGQVGHAEAGKVELEKDAPRRFVGVPRMSAIARHLATGLSTDFSARVLAIKKEGREWSLEVEDADSVCGFDLVLSAVPAPQAIPLLASSPELAAVATRARMLPCHALMVRFEAEVGTTLDAAFVRSPELSWAARNGSKPDRDPAPTWVFHSTPEWSRAHLEAGPEEVADSLLAAFETATGIGLPGTEYFAAHRWLYARSEGPHDGEPLWDADAGLGACGDWVEGSRVEDAFLSAQHLFEAILQR